MASTADTSVSLSQEWLAADKIRRAMLQELERVKKPSIEGSETDRFVKLAGLMAQLRLKCMIIFYSDIEYASQQKVENILWAMHVHLNSAYRIVRDRQEKQQKKVTKRSIEKLYEQFIKTGQEFYKAHLQRVCSRFTDVPELQRLVTGGVVEKFETLGDEVRLDATAAGIQDQVLASAYLTLTYLGDLWRYRTQLRHADRRDYRNALAYYSLAADLDPSSGYAYHQMGVIYLEQGMHFDIVYHFYRSLAADKPHPNAVKNLENEFGSVMRASASRPGKGPHDALLDWVVRLHAHFYAGKAFSQHAELENEVIHRLGLAVKAHNFGTGLVRIALVNICAYQLAKDRITAGWTEKISQTCQFTLGLNIRTICVILHKLEPELVEVADNLRKAASGQQNGSTDNGSKINAVVSHALPVLRVYMTWMCMYRSDIVEFEPHLRPYVGQLYSSLSGVLSTLFEVLYHYPGLESVPYLFPEDIEALGLKALDSPAIPANCRLGIDPITRKPKSRPDEADGKQFSPDDVSFTRALDVTTRGFMLVDDAEFPLTLSETHTPEGHHLVKVIYLAEGRPPTPTTTASQVQVARTFASPTVAGTGLAQPASTRSPARVGGANGFAEAVTLHGGQQVPLSARPIFPVQVAEEANYAVDHDSRMNDLVNGLVEPSEFDASEAFFGQNDTSYGMHTATARDVFGSALPSTTPGLSANGNGLPSHPSAWTTVAEPASHQRGVSSGSARDGWTSAVAPPQPVSKRNSMGGMTPVGTTNTSNPYGAIGDVNGHRTATGSATSSGQGSWGHARQHSYGQGGPLGLGAYGFTPSTNSPWNQGTSVQDLLGAQLGALVSGPTAAVRPLASTPAPVSPAMPSPFASTNFSGATSSLPPVNSPHGLTTRFGGGSTNNPGPIGPPPGSSSASRPGSKGSHNRASSSSNWRRDDTALPGPVAKPSYSRPNSGPTTPGLSGASPNGSASGPPQQPSGQPKEKKAAFEAMLRKLHKPES